MDQWLKDRREEARAAYGTMPPEDEERMRRTLSALEEEPPMRRKVTSTVALALVLVLLLAGVALAITRGYGVLDFLSGGKGIDASPIEDRVQTEFAQAGGEMENVSVRVRDAVTDGITLLLTVELKAKDPEAVLMHSGDHSVLFLQAQGIDARGDSGRDRNEPDWASFPEDQRYIYVDMPAMKRNDDGSYENPLAFTIGDESYYEDPQTIVHTMIYDITRLEDPGEALPLHISVSEVYVKEVRDTDREGNALGYSIQSWDRVEQADIAVEVSLAPMETKVFRPTEEVVRVGHLEFSDITFTMSPYATYMECNRNDNPDPPDPETLVTLPKERIDGGLYAQVDDLGRLYWQMHYGYVITKTEQQAPLERERFLLTGHPAPYPSTITMQAFYQIDSGQVYEVAVALEEVPEG